MKKGFYSLLLCTAIGAHVNAQYSPTLDLSFDSDGIFVHDYGFHDNLQAVAVQSSDNSIVSVGAVVNTGAFGGSLLVQRILSTGEFDPSFNTTGFLTIEDYQESYAYDVEILSSGKILVAGAAANAQYEFFALVLRLNSDGTLDPTFGTNGVTLINLAPRDEFAYAMDIQSDGKIVVAGSAGDALNKNMPVVYRLNEDGSVDSAFGTNGMTALPVSEIDNDFSSVSIRTDGTIVASGHISQALTPQGQQNFDVLVAKFLPNGQLDVNFGTSGLVVTSVSQTLSEEAYGMVISEGEILVCGYSLSSTYLYQHFIIRYKANGDLVTTFGNNGIVLSDLTIGTVAYDMALDNDGRILVTGYVGTSFADLDFFLAAYEDNGSLDITFGNQGMVRTDAMGDFDEAYGIFVQPNGSIVLAGKGSNGANNDAVVMRFANDMATEISKATDEDQVSFYPNPATDVLNITGLAGNGMVSVLNTIGQELLTVPFQNSDRMILNLSELTSGVYLVQIRTENGITTRKVRLIRS
ncbi:MAG: T9SS type A sorting domain-containing protein [Flavobacteriales bacterium]|nr:T9SS type A sorting domain-containing protein [Flavobacteriales bacterium]